MFITVAETRWTRCELAVPVATGVFVLRYRRALRESVVSLEERCFRAAREPGRLGRHRAVPERSVTA